MPSQCGISALVLFQASMLEVTAIPDKFEQSEFQKCEIWILEKLGLMQKYFAFYESLPELVIYAANMKGIARIMQIPRVCAMMGYNFGRSIPELWESRWSYNFRQKRRLVDQNLNHLAATLYFAQSEQNIT